MKSVSKGPSPSKNIFTDIWRYLIYKPGIRTLVEHHDTESREEISKSILQRTGIDVENYRMLNLHSIGINSPASHIFDELMKWSGDSICWPNYIAKVNLQNGGLEKIKIFLFGWKMRIFRMYPFHLFDLNAIRIQKVPDKSDYDNARYLLYECKGGYPIGIFSMYVRSSIKERKEEEMSQLYMLVSFNFYGKKRKRLNIFNRTWEAVHNRATSNILIRFKQLCEYKFENFVG
jgi:hypothetical protein